MAQNMIDTRRSRPAKLDVYTDGVWGSWDAWSGCPISQNKCIKGMLIFSSRDDGSVLRRI